tara:strand:+ start:2479 stop:2781 length:303 start_codon:yes stop_codon:yes gene_type:complete
MKTISEGLLHVYLNKTKAYHLKKTLNNKINGRSFVDFDTYINNDGDYIFSHKCEPSHEQWTKMGTQQLDVRINKDVLYIKYPSDINQTYIKKNICVIYHK